MDKCQWQVNEIFNNIRTTAENSKKNRLASSGLYEVLRNADGIGELVTPCWVWLMLSSGTQEGRVVDGDWTLQKSCWNISCTFWRSTLFVFSALASTYHQSKLKVRRRKGISGPYMCTPKDQSDSPIIVFCFAAWKGTVRETTRRIHTEAAKWV